MNNTTRLRGPYFLRRELSQQCEELLKLIQTPDADLRDVAGYVSDHPLLADAFIRQANSPLHATGHRVRNVHHAVSLLGINRIRTFAARFATGDPAYNPWSVSAKN